MYALQGSPSRHPLPVSHHMAFHFHYRRLLWYHHEVLGRHAVLFRLSIAHSTCRLTWIGNVQVDDGDAADRLDCAALDCIVDCVRVV